MVDKLVTDTEAEVPGDWAVDDDTCVACGSPPAIAPDLMGFGKNHAQRRSTHCYFKKQPSTPEELARACRAAEASCVGAVRYRGSDPNLLEAMASLEATGLLPETLAMRKAALSRARRNGRRVVLAVLLSSLVVATWYVATYLWWTVQ